MTESQWATVDPEEDKVRLDLLIEAFDRIEKLEKALRALERHVRPLYPVRAR